MDKYFTFRLERMTRDRLGKLAKQTQRSRGGVLRWLILNSNIPKDIVSPTISDLPEVNDHFPPVEGEKEGKSSRNS